MEDIVQYQLFLQEAAAIVRKLERLVEEGKEDSGLGLSGEAATIYRQHCDKASEKLKDMQKRIMVLISESSAGII